MRAAYAFQSDDCEPELGAMDPNFVEDDIEGGFHLLPDSAPAGLYERVRGRRESSRGTRRIVQVLYTVAARWNELRPEFVAESRDPQIQRGLVQLGSSRSTHDDGTHADLVVRLRDRQFVAATECGRGPGQAVRRHRRGLSGSCSWTRQ